jgi:hypothetical protein
MPSLITLENAFQNMLPEVDPVSVGFNVSNQGMVSPEAMRIETSARRVGIMGLGSSHILPAFRPGSAGFPLQPQGYPLSPQAMAMEGLYGPTPGDDDYQAPANGQPGSGSTATPPGVSKPLDTRTLLIGAGVAVGVGAVLWYMFR